MAKKGKKKRDTGNDSAKQQAEILKELQAMRAMLMLLVLKVGGTTKELAAALDVTNQQISQMIPARKIKKLKFGKGAGEDSE